MEIGVWTRKHNGPKGAEPRTSGFTLVELVLIIVLLGILSSVAVPRYMDIRKEANESVQQQIEAALQTTLNHLYVRQVVNGEPFTVDDIVESTTVFGGTLTVEDISP